MGEFVQGGNEERKLVEVVVDCDVVKFFVWFGSVVIVEFCSLWIGDREFN